MRKTNMWKIVSICFIVLFAAIIIGGLLRAYHFGQSTIRATDSEINNAKTIALNDLTTKGIDIKNYSVKVSDVIRNVDKQGVMEVSIYNDTIRYTYLIDKSTSNIDIYSVIEFHDGLNHSNDINRGPGMPGFFH